MPTIIEVLEQTPVEDQRVELVERKGIGHPDTICDSIMERISVGLSAEYLGRFGRVLHHNTDKGLLVAGRSSPRPGGGSVLEPMRLVVGDRAVVECDGQRIDVAAIVERCAREWLREHLRFVDPDRHVVIQNELRPGSPELSGLYERGRPAAANDTSVGVGYAPLTETERLVLAAERFLNSPELKRAHPEAGEDVKVMGRRMDRRLDLTVAVAFVDRFVSSVASYEERKRALAAALREHLAARQGAIDSVQVQLNVLDDPSRGDEGIYLTVLGTSADGADCGQVGRGNRVNGLISFGRPMSTEAAAGKNPTRHVGKIYSLLAHQLAGRIHREVGGLREVQVRLCSQIGALVSEPWVASVQLLLGSEVELSDVRRAVENIVADELAHTERFTLALVRGELPIC